MIKKNKGFTVVELIVSISLLALILIPLSKFFVDSFRVQTRSQTKSSITRVGQYVIESFKNKNYLGFDFSNVKVKEDNNGKPINEFTSGTIKSYTKEIEYGGLKYSVNLELDEKPTINDTTDLEIPENFDGEIIIGADGKISGVYGTGYTLTSKNIGENFSNRGKNYTASIPILILSNGYTDETHNHTLLIKNEYVDDLRIGIVKNFNNPLKIYVKGKQVYFEDGALGDGRSAKMAKFEAAYISTDVDSIDNGNIGELLLEATLTITDLRDTTVRDIFEITFPIEYDYSKNI